jgi:Putative ATP-binding cassette
MRVSTTALILRAEWLNARHWLLDTKQGRSVSFGMAIAAVFLGPLLIGGAGVAGFALGSFGIDSAGIFAGGFSAVALLMFLFGLPGIISAFFADRQLLLFAAAPISSLQLFVARLIQASLPAGLVGVVVLALVFGYGIGARLNPAFGLLAIVLIAALALSVVSVEVCVMSLVLRVVPATRARDVAGIMLALLGSSFYLLQFALRGPIGKVADDPNQALRQASALGGALIWLPTSWPAEALAAWAVHGPIESIGWTAMTIVAMAVAVVAGWFLHKQTFVLGLGVFGEAGAGSTRRRRSRAQPSAARATPANPMAAIARKDFLGLRRDFRRLAGVLPALGMAVVYAFANSGHVVGGFWGVVLPIAFVPGFVSLSVAVPAVGTEGRGMQLLVLAGLPMRKLLLAKLLFALPIVLLLTVGTALALSLTNGAGPVEMAAAVLFGVWLGFGAPAIAVAAGAIGPNFAATDPRRGVNPGWMIGGMIMIAVFGALSYGALAAFWFAAGGTLAPLLLPAGLLLLASSAAVVGGMLLVGLRALEHWRPGE